MEVKTFPYGPLGANLYVLENNGRVVIIDPCVRPEKCSFEDYIDRVDAVLITHGHFDHILFADRWIEEIRSRGNKDAALYIHPLDKGCLGDSTLNLSAEFGYDIHIASEAKDITELDRRTFPLGDAGGCEIKVIHTPGHSRGEVCIGFRSGDQELMFTGDMLFAGAVGRSDFVGSDTSDMMSSVRVLSDLPDDVKVYPGHGPSTKMGIEKQFNPYFRGV